MRNIAIFAIVGLIAVIAVQPTTTAAIQQPNFANQDSRLEQVRVKREQQILKGQTFFDIILSVIETLQYGRQRTQQGAKIGRFLQ